MKVFITGGSGLIGSALVPELVHNGYEVIILSRQPEKIGSLPFGASAMQWDGLSGDGWAEMINSGDIIVNLAGEPLAPPNPFFIRWTKSRKESIMSSRLQAGRAVMDAIQNAPGKPGLVIQASAIGMYNSPFAGLFNESSPVGNDFLAQVCKTWEASTSQVREMGIRRVALRIGLVLSNEGGIFPALKTPYIYGLGGRLGSGEQIISWIHIQDFVSAILYLIQNPRMEGVFNLTSPQSVTNEEFSQQLAARMDKPARFPVPAGLIEFLLGEAASLVLEGQKVIPARLQESGFTFRYPDFQSALEELIPASLLLVETGDETLAESEG